MSDWIALADNEAIQRGRRVMVVLRTVCTPVIGPGILAGFKDDIRAAVNRSADISVVEVAEAYGTIFTPGVTDWEVTIDLIKDFTAAELRGLIDIQAQDALIRSWCFSIKVEGPVRFLKPGTVPKVPVTTAVTTVALVAGAFLLYFAYKEFSR